MWADAYAVEDQNIEALHQLDGFVRNEIQVGRVGKVVKSIRDHGKLAVNDLKRRHLNVADRERRIVINRVRYQLRQAAADVVRLEDVLENSPEVFPRGLIRIDGHRAISKIQWTDVVKTEYVIDVTMRYQNRIEKFYLCS